MQTDIRHGCELIAAIIRQKNEREAFELYWFARQNGINQKHDSHLKLLPAKPVQAPKATRTAEDIFEEVHTKMKVFMRG